MKQPSTEHLLHQLHHLSRRIHRRQKSARGIDLLRGQGRLLRALEQHDGKSQQELAEEIRIRPASLSELIIKMEQSGYVRREVDQADRRRYRIYITEQGREVAEQTRKARIEVSEEVFSVLDEKEQAQLAKLLQKVLDNLERSDDGSHHREKKKSDKENPHKAE